MFLVAQDRIKKFLCVPVCASLHYFSPPSLKPMQLKPIIV